MKLTEKKLKQLIREELENLQVFEADTKEASTDPIKYFDSVIPDYMKGAERHPRGKQELEAAKESLIEAVQSLEIKELVIPVPENLREKYKGHIIKAIKTWVEKGEYEMGKDDFKVLKKYLYDNTQRFKESIATSTLTGKLGVGLKKK